MMDTEEKNKFFELLTKAFEGQISSEEVRVLNDCIKNTQGAAKCYIEFFDDVTSLMDINLSSVSTEPDDMSNVLQDLVEYEKKSPTIPHVCEGEYVEGNDPKTLENNVQSEFELKRTNKFFIIFDKLVYIAAIFMIIFVIYANVFPPQLSVQVATVQDQMDVVWNTSSVKLTNGEQIFANQRPYKLDKGIIQFSYEHGVNVLVEAPAEFIIPAQNQIVMNLGRTFVSVPESSIGFEVNTPCAKIVDLGTEFGVGVDIRNTVRTIVYKGKVEMSIPPEQANPGKFLIVKGQLGVLEKHGQLSITEISPNYSEFACGMNDYQSGLSLLDRNLITNGDFEQDRVVYESLDIDSIKLSNNNISIAGWQDTTPATINTYATFGTGEIDASERAAIPVPSQKGNNFFDGHKSCTITQEIDLEDISYKINRSEVNYELSGWVGGWHRQEDTLEFSASYLDNSGRLIEIATIRSLTASERNNKTCFVKRSEKGPLPEGVRKIIISLTTKLIEGETADAYADNLEFILSDNNIASRR